MCWYTRHAAHYIAEQRQKRSVRSNNGIDYKSELLVVVHYYTLYNIAIYIYIQYTYTNYTSITSTVLVLQNNSKVAAIE